MNTLTLPLLRLSLSIAIWCGCSTASLAAPEGTTLRSSERLALVKQRGTLVVGVKTDYPPFGQLNPSGVPEGFEHDLAEDLAKRLGVKLVKQSVTGANRLQKLEEGAVDLVLATTGDTAERRKIATMIEPNYYASGVTLFMAPDQNIADWSETRGKKVCATQGSYFNRAMAQRYLLDLQMFTSARDAKLAVKDKRCVGYLFDNTAIAGDLRLPEWAGYKAPLQPVLNTPWAIAIARRDAGTDFERIVSDAVADWHRSGFAAEREKAWGLPPSKFLSDSHSLWKRVGPDAKPVCTRGADGQWPSACRNPVFLNSNDSSGLRRLGLWVKESTGVDLSLIYDDYDRGRFVSGLGTTLLLMLLCVAGSLLVGVIGAWLAEARLLVISPLARLACVVGRMTPPLLLMYVMVFGLGSALMARYGIHISALAVVVGCLSYYTGASVMNALLYSADAKRESEPGYQLQWHTLKALARSSSGHITAALINVSKATMMASAVAVPELLSAVTSIMADNGNVAVMMNSLLLTFLILVFAAVRLLKALERKFVGGAP